MCFPELKFVHGSTSPQVIQNETYFLDFTLAHQNIMTIYIHAKVLRDKQL